MGISTSQLPDCCESESEVNKIHILWNKSQKNILFEINTVSLKFFDEYCIISPDKYIQYDVLYDAYCVYITKFISLDHIKAYQYMQNPRLYFNKYVIQVNGKIHNKTISGIFLKNWIV